MPSLRLPSFFHPRHPFRRLHSFHLSPNAGPQLNVVQPPSPPLPPQVDSKPPLVYYNPSLSLRGAVTVKLAFVVSLVFVALVSFSFMGASVDEEYFRLSLEKVADTDPGIVLLGENVDVDVDEPSITIRWSIVACGEDLTLPGSAGVRGVANCGLPSTPLHIFVDNKPAPAATYDPMEIPFNRQTGSRRSIQNLVQFDSDHVLDVHRSRLYPFDTYMLSSTIRALSFNNETLPIRKIVTIDITSSFNILTTDIESFSTSENSLESTSRDIDMQVSRPNSARVYIFIIFGLNWVLAHVTIGLVLVCRQLSEKKPISKHLVSTGAIVIGIPQLRASMPDAPGFDGVLIDTIGFFPQVIIAGISALLILLILISREIDITRQGSAIAPILRTYPPPPPAALNRIPSPSAPNKDSDSTQIAQYEMHRLMKHMRGEYVFPPVNIRHSAKRSSEGSMIPHRRTRTMPKIREGSEASHYSDWVE